MENKLKKFFNQNLRLRKIMFIPPVVILAFAVYAITFMWGGFGYAIPAFAVGIVWYIVFRCIYMKEKDALDHADKVIAEKMQKATEGINEFVSKNKISSPKSFVSSVYINDGTSVVFKTKEGFFSSKAMICAVCFDKRSGNLYLHKEDVDFKTGESDIMAFPLKLSEMLSLDIKEDKSSNNNVSTTQYIISVATESQKIEMICKNDNDIFSLISDAKDQINIKD